MMLLGIASFLSPIKLRRTIETIRAMTSGDWRCLIVHNQVDREQDAIALSVAREALREDSRFRLIVQPNSGYCGAVNALLEAALESDADSVLYCDNDIEIRTHGWNEQMRELLEANTECGWVFPGDGHYSFDNGRYRESLWHAGYCWLLSMKARQKVEQREAAMFLPSYLRAGFFNEKLGHHEEVEWMQRLRLAGFTTACIPSIDVIHHETATNANAADHQPGGRIHDGVVSWMNANNRYFCGDQLTYSMTAYDPRALRYTDWNANALYLERWVKAQFPDWNAAPRTVMTSAGPMDAIEILKPKGCYVGRAI